MVRGKAAAFLLLTTCALAACRYPRPEVTEAAVTDPAGIRTAGENIQQTAPDQDQPKVPTTASGDAGLTNGERQVRASEPSGALRPPPPGPADDLARHGRAIVEDTPRALAAAAGSDSPSVARLSCRNCHLDAGTRDTAFPWLGLASAYPRYEARTGRVVTLEERVNECLVRCLNASPLPVAGREMEAIIAYIRFLPQPDEDGSPSPPSPLPDRRADLAAGVDVYASQCRSCHGDNGEGGHDAPPLWGPGSYSTGAPMHRLLTAAAFIRAQMPPGQGLTPEQALDVAGFVNSFARPETADLHLDYPALSEKPVDSPYPPYPDRFPSDQHKYGPFAEILADWQKQSGRQKP